MRVGFSPESDVSETCPLLSTAEAILAQVFGGSGDVVGLGNGFVMMDPSGLMKLGNHSMMAVLQEIRGIIPHMEDAHGVITVELGAT